MFFLRYNQSNLLCKSFKKCVEDFLTKISSLKMSQGPIGSRNQAEVGVNRKNKIPQSFLEPIELHK